MVAARKRPDFLADQAAAEPSSPTGTTAPPRRHRQTAWPPARPGCSGWSPWAGHSGHGSVSSSGHRLSVTFVTTEAMNASTSAWENESLASSASAIVPQGCPPSTTSHTTPSCDGRTQTTMVGNLVRRSRPSREASDSNATDAGSTGRLSPIRPHPRVGPRYREQGGPNRA